VAGISSLMTRKQERTSGSVVWHVRSAQSPYSPGSPGQDETTRWESLLEHKNLDIGCGVWGLWIPLSQRDRTESAVLDREGKSFGDVSSWGARPSEKKTGGSGSVHGISA